MATVSTWIPQAGVIAVKSGLVCLVTSSSGRRWVVPKGCLEPGKTAGEIALQEAWEEAGLVGVLRGEPLGSYLYDKYGSTCHVTVFLMEVTDVSDNWPERSLRRRVWLTPEHAADRIDEAGLQGMIRNAAD
jgi:8-oxo-dGTP pyrophosphatase MutT (NUDIX family)